MNTGSPPKAFIKARRTGRNIVGAFDNYQRGQNDLIQQLKNELAKFLEPCDSVDSNNPGPSFSQNCAPSFCYDNDGPDTVRQ